MVGTDAGRRGPEEAQLSGHEKVQTRDEHADEKMGSTVRGGLWSGLEADDGVTLARIALGLCQKNSQKTAKFT